LILAIFKIEGEGCADFALKTLFLAYNHLPVCIGVAGMRIIILLAIRMVGATLQVIVVGEEDHWNFGIF